MNRLAELRKAKRWSQARLAKESGLSQPVIARYETGERQPKLWQLERIAGALGISAPDLVAQFAEAGAEIIRDTARTVPVVGYVGAGHEVHRFDDDPSSDRIEEAEAPPGAGEHTEAVIVSGQSMAPAFRDRDIIYYEKRELGPEDLIGRECVVGLADGRTFVKVLQRGSDRGLYNLFSYNAPLITDVAVNWAMRVRWVSRED